MQRSHDQGSALTLTANVDSELIAWADAGVLVALTNGRRNRAWEPEGLIDLVVALEAGET